VEVTNAETLIQCWRQAGNTTLQLQSQEPGGLVGTGTVW